MSKRFYFIANDLALDFANTLIADDNGEPLELLRSVQDLYDWLSAAGLEDPKPARTAAGQGPDNYRRALAFRGELKKMAMAVSEGKQVPRSAIEAINDVLSSARGHFRLTPTKNGYKTEFQTDRHESPDLLLPVAQSAAKLLSEGDLSLVRKCQREACVLYFYDTSKRHGRQWCTMTVCGNRAKAAAHYRRSHLQ